jgi:predicted HicB family RNase H-like nuclease
MERLQAIQRRAQELFTGQADWATFFREILGVNGIIHQMYPAPEALAEFKQTPEYENIHQMLGQLRSQNSQPPNGEEPTRVITVRLPKSIHEWLQQEAYNHHTSMNKLCITRLIGSIEGQAIPAEA